MLAQLLLAFALSALGCAFVVRSALPGAARYPDNRPQRFHVGNVPRLGGLAMAVAFVVVGLFGVWADMHVRDPMIGNERWWLLLALAILPAWLAGLVEDWTHTVHPAVRLLATMLSAAILVFMLDFRIDRLGIPVVDGWWSEWSVGSALLAFIALTSMPHAFNIIDGYNGLASTVTLMVAAALIYVAMKVGDWHWMSVMITLFGVTLGFWIWNYPRGLLFAGDCGSYLWGLIVAAGSIGLVQRNPMVSPWFPVLLLSYPIMETVFSVYRKTVRGQSPSVADALHFHQLIYRRIVRGVFHDDQTRQILMRNNRTSPYLWGMALLAVVPSVIFWSNGAVLVVFVAVFMFIYVTAYLMIVRFKVPRWLRR